jgi:hypothetical protein
MKHTFIATFLAVVLAVPAFADVTLKQTTTGKGMGMSGTTTVTTYIKGNRMRSDTKIGDKTQTTIYDLDAQKMFIFESGKKEADVWDMTTFAAELSKNVDTANMKASITPNGQTKPIAGQTATGYDLEISVPASMGGSKDMSMTINMTGPMWVVKDAPGTADYLRFYKAATEKGWVFMNPQAAKNSPGQAKALAEMYKQLAEAGGIAYESEMQIKMGGAGGPMAGLFAKLGNMSMATKVDAVETGPLADDLFAPPAGMKLNTKK